MPPRFLLLPSRVLIGRSLLAVICLVLLVLGARILMAELHARQVRAFLADWAATDSAPSERAWSVALNAAQQALRWYPVTHGEHVEQLGRVYQWRYRHANPGRAEAMTTRQLALDAYRQATALRPLSPYPWARMVQVKMSLLAFDAEFDQALRQAVALGPWRPRVNDSVVRTGILAWRRLSVEQRELVLASAGRAAVQDVRAGQELLAFSARFGLQALFCGAMTAARGDGKLVCGPPASGGQ